MCIVCKHIVDIFYPEIEGEIKKEIEFLQDWIDNLVHISRAQLSLHESFEKAYIVSTEKLEKDIKKQPEYLTPRTFSMILSYLTLRLAQKEKKNEN